MNNVASIRKLRGMTQQHLADAVGVKQPHISRIEKGDEGPPLSLFRLIAEALNVELSDLFDTEHTKSRMMLMDAFDQLPSDRQRGWVDMARAAIAEVEEAEQ